MGRKENAGSVYRYPDYQVQDRGGLGLLIQVSNYVDLDFRASYLQTGKQEKLDHVDLESVTEQNNIIKHDFNCTEVSPWNFQVGVHILAE